MKKICIADMTLSSSSGAPSTQLSFKEKIEIAKHLENSGVDVIELHSIENEKTDTLLVRTVSSFAKNSIISVPVGTTPESVDIAANAVSAASRPRLRVCVPVSTVQMEYVYHMKPAAVIKHISEFVAKCRQSCQDVEFRALDATRAEPEFLSEAIKAAIEAGATTVTVCDNEGSMMPDTFANFVSDFIKTIPEISGVSLGILCENKYNMAVSAVMLAIRAGASEVKVAACDNSLPSLEMISQIIKDCGDRCGICSGLKYTELLRHTKQINWIKRADKTSIGSYESRAAVSDTNSEVMLTIDDDMSTVIRAVQNLGYDLSDEDNAKVYESFKKIADTKKVSSRELDAIVASVSLQVPPTYRLIDFLIASSNVTAPVAHVTLEKDGKELNGVCSGNGPIDAAFLAIEQIVGHHYELDDFQVQAVTEGRGSIGSTVIRLVAGGKIYSGNGISTDIIEASIMAYMSALNKIAYEEA